MGGKGEGRWRTEALPREGGGRTDTSGVTGRSRTGKWRWMLDVAGWQGGGSYRW